MKSLKIVAGSLLLSCLVISGSSFLSNDFRENAFAYKCFKYQPGIFRSLDVAYWDVVQPWQLVTPDNWVVYADIPELTCTPGRFICRICFDDSQLNSTITFNALLQEFYDYLYDTGVPPHATSILLNVNGTLISVTVYLHDTADII